MKRNGAWYYRRRVPTPLVPKFGDFIQFSLHTVSKKLAIRQREMLDVEWTRKFEAAEVPLKGEAARTEPISAAQARVLTEAEAIERVRIYVEQTDDRRRKNAFGEPAGANSRPDCFSAGPARGEPSISVRTSPRHKNAACQSPRRLGRSRAF